MNIIHISAECYPVAKTGGLGDVLGALPRYQSRMKHQVSIVMPMLDSSFVHNHDFDTVDTQDFLFGNLSCKVNILKEKNDSLGFKLFLIKIPFLFPREKVYGYSDDIDRFIAFQISVLNWLLKNKKKPDLIHCHDHHTGLISFMIKHCHRYKSIKDIPTIFTIHNANYQGQFSWDKNKLIPSYSNVHFGFLDWDGIINSMACAIKCSNIFTTVSEGYKNELLNGNHPLKSLFVSEGQKFFGIINGIDFNEWNPKTDTKIDFNYTAKNVSTGKNKNKIEFFKQYKYEDKKSPIISYIGRFALEKGTDILPRALFNFLTKGENVNFFILGSGNKHTEQEFYRLQNIFSNNINVCIGYNEGLAHKLYASSDFLLMPSRIEPCGLNQMYAMRYGTIPIVRKIGGLSDTVPDIGDDGLGITFLNLEIDDIQSSIQRALNLYSNKKELLLLRRKIMRQQFTWKDSAKIYLTLYEKLQPNKH